MAQFSGLRWRAAGRTLVALLLLIVRPSSAVVPVAAVSSGGATKLRMGKDVYGKLEIFLDLGEPESSAAWPILKRAIDDYSKGLEFVFHVTPPSGSPIASTLRKAGYLLGVHGTEGEAKAFLDQVFTNQALFLRKGKGEEDIMENWVVSPSSSFFDIFEFVSSGLEGPEIDEQLADALDSMTPPLLGIRSTAVYLDGILMMYLDEAEMDASRGLGPYLEGYMGWKANGLLLEKHNSMVLGQNIDVAGRQAGYEIRRSLFDG